MKFTTTTGELQRALSKASSVVPTKTTTPIVENILFELLNNTLTLKGTDNEIFQIVSITVKGTEDGRIAIPSKRLLETIRALPDTEVSFTIDTTIRKIRLTTRNGEYSISGEDADEFPVEPRVSKADEVEFEGKLLKRIINRTVFAVSTDELRPAMMGVFFHSKGNELRAVSTDGHRLVRYTYKMEEGGTVKRDIIVPAKALNIVNRTLESEKVRVAIAESNIQFAFDTSIIISRLIDETYPNYESVIPTENNKVLTVHRENFMAAIRRVSLYASATTHHIKLSLRKDEVTVSAQDIDFGGEAKETLECEYAADDLDIGFNSVYLIDILSHLDSEKVVCKFSSPTRAGIIAPAGENVSEDVLMLVMPVRLSA
ncbi:MAG: DNA polymerase III subunit beta [Ignavibacteria bacterium]